MQLDVSPLEFNVIALRGIGFSCFFILCRSRSRKVADNICSLSHFAVDVSWDQSLHSSISCPTFSLL